MSIKQILAVAAVLCVSCCATPSGEGQRFAHHVLTSRGDPEITLRIDTAFRALPPMDVPIGGLTVARRFVFVDAGADRVVRRMIVVQFERVNAGNAFRFVYPSRPPRQFGAQMYRFGTYVYDDARAADAAPDREAGRTRALLQAQGLHAPRLWRTARLARVSDAAGMSEIIIFYCENADADYPASGPLPGADEDGDVPLEGAARDALAARMEAAVRATRG